MSGFADFAFEMKALFCYGCSIHFRFQRDETTGIIQIVHPSNANCVNSEKRYAVPMIPLDSVDGEL